MLSLQGSGGEKEGDVWQREVAAKQCNRSNLPPLSPLHPRSLITSAVQQLVFNLCWNLLQPDMTVAVSRSSAYTLNFCLLRTLSLLLHPPALLFVYLPPDGMWFASAVCVFVRVCVSERLRAFICLHMLLFASRV